MTGPIPKKKKEKPQLTPEQVAAHESMKPDPYAKQKGIGAAAPYSRNKKKTPTLNHTTPKKMKTKSVKVDPTLTMDIFTLRQQPLSDAKIEQIAYRLVQWCMTKKQSVMDDFLQEEGYHLTNFNRLCDRSYKLKEAYEFAMMCIGNYREHKGLENKYNAAMVMKSMPSYSPRWKDLLKWHAEINTQNQNVNQGVQIVEIPAAEKTSIVPPLKKDKEE